MLGRNNELNFKFGDSGEWSEKYMKDVIDILRNECIGHIAPINFASRQQDTEEATDLVVNLSRLDIAVRVRKPNCKHRDLTIRSFNRGYKTELEKIRSGYGDFYLYAWTDHAGINEWMLVDLATMRMSKIIYEERSEISNYDGTCFVGYKIAELQKHGALVKYVKER